MTGSTLQSSSRRRGKIALWLAITLSWVAGCASAAEPGYALGPVAMDSYTQSIVITLKTAEAARRARLNIAPLYHDLRAAVSTRMDDSNLNNLAVAQIMAKHGQHGTFYLNNPEKWWQDSPDTGIEVTGDRGSIIPPRLLSNGNSIGGHTLSHEFLPALSANAAFREIMGVRVTLETRTASPVRSFVYPFVHYRTGMLEGRDQSDLEEMLRRAGYYQLGEDRYNTNWDSGLQDGVFVALDGRTDGFMDLSALDTSWCEATRPLFLITMHAWVGAWGGPQFPKLEALYRDWSGRTDAWYCNQNQYAAYRYQARHSRLTSRVEGNTLRAVLIRPDPLDLDDPTPLTLRVEGVPPDDVLSVDGAQAEVKTVPLAGAYAFDLFHGRERGGIEAYARTENQENRGEPGELATAVEGLQAWLFRSDRTLRLALRNAGEKVLRDIRVTFRLPLRWQEGVLRRTVDAMPGGAGTTLEIALTERSDPVRYADGKEYNVAQIDFRGERTVRLYATCETSDLKPAEYFACDGFRTLGPLPAASAGFDLSAWVKPFLEGGKPPPNFEMPGGGRIVWGALARAQVSFLDPDIIPTTGTSNMAEYRKRNVGSLPAAAANSIHFLLWSRIVSPRAQTVRLVASAECVRQISVNGRMIEENNLELQEGPNEVRMLYAPAQAVPGLDRSFDISVYGCYFRLVDANGNRVRDIRYEPPQTGS